MHTKHAVKVYIWVGTNGLIGGLRILLIGGQALMGGGVTLSWRYPRYLNSIFSITLHLNDSKHICVNSGLYVSE